jgi:hypothetical protein
MCIILRTLYRDIRDLLSLFSSPRSFFQKVSVEGSAATILRLLLYGILFDLLFALVLFPEVRKPARIPLLYVFTLGISEGLIAILLGAMLYATTRLLRPQPKFKVVVAYAVIGKFFFLTPAVICFGYYLLKESVAVLAARGAIVWLASLLIPVVCPFLIAPSANRRTMVSLLSLVILIVARVAIIVSPAHGNSQISTPVSRFAFLYDPVAAEMDRYNPTENVPQVDLSRLLQAQELVIHAVQTDSDGTAHFNLRQIQEGAILINAEASTIGDYARDHLGLLSSIDNGAVFVSTEKMVTLMRLDFDSLSSLSDRTTVRIPRFAFDVIGVLDSPVATSKCLDRHLETHFRLIGFLDSTVLSRYRLRKCLLSAW